MEASGQKQLRRRPKARRRVTAGGGHQPPLPGSHPRTARAPARGGGRGSTASRDPVSRRGRGLPCTPQPGVPASGAAPPSLSPEGKGWSSLAHVPSFDRSLKSVPGHHARGSASPAPRCPLLRVGQQAPERPQPRAAARPATVTSGASGAQRCWAGQGHHPEQAQSAAASPIAHAHTPTPPPRYVPLLGSATPAMAAAPAGSGHAPR